MLLDQTADSMSWVMGSASAGNTISVDLFAMNGSLVNSFTQVLSDGYNLYSFSSLGSFSGITFSNNNDPYGVRFMDFTYNTAVPVPAAVWLFGSGLLGLIAVARKKAQV